MGNKRGKPEKAGKTQQNTNTH